MKGCMGRETQKKVFWPQNRPPWKYGKGWKWSDLLTRTGGVDLPPTTHRVGVGTPTKVLFLKTKNLQTEGGLENFRFVYGQRAGNRAKIVGNPWKYFLKWIQNNHFWFEHCLCGKHQNVKKSVICSKVRENSILWSFSGAHRWKAFSIFWNLPRRGGRSPDTPLQTSGGGEGPPPPTRF